MHVDGNIWFIPLVSAHEVFLILHRWHSGTEKSGLGSVLPSMTPVQNTLIINLYVLIYLILRLLTTLWCFYSRVSLSSNRRNLASDEYSQLINTSMGVTWVCMLWNCFALRCLVPWASYQIRKIVGCACAGNAGNVSPATDFKGNR